MYFLYGYYVKMPKSIQIICFSLLKQLVELLWHRTDLFCTTVYLKYHQFNQTYTRVESMNIRTKDKFQTTVVNFNIMRQM